MRNENNNGKSEDIHNHDYDAGNYSKPIDDVKLKQLVQVLNKYLPSSFEYDFRIEDEIKITYASFLPNADSLEQSINNELKESGLIYRVKLVLEH